MLADSFRRFRRGRAGARLDSYARRGEGRRWCPCAPRSGLPERRSVDAASGKGEGGRPGKQDWHIIYDRWLTSQSFCGLGPDVPASGGVDSVASGQIVCITAAELRALCSNMALNC